MPKFSIITPVHLWNEERVNAFCKTMKSVQNQTYRDFEWIVIDDGSVMPFLWTILEHLDFPVKLKHLPHQERVIAYNEAFKMVKGDWFVLLDSDDELRPNALEKMVKMIHESPKIRMFNFGCEYLHKDGAITQRDPFTPKRAQTGHEVFGGGNIVNGTFIWHRLVYKKLGAYPGDEQGNVDNVDCSEINYGGVRDLFMGSPWDFSAAAQLEFPQMRDYFMVDHEAEPEKIIKELGNPWGQDYYLFYKYTRKYHSKPIKENLYLVHQR